MENPLTVDPTVVQDNNEKKGEDGPLRTTCLSGPDNNHDQQLSSQTAASSSESIISKNAMLREENARLKAQLALFQQIMPDVEVEIAKKDNSSNVVNVQLISRMQDLLKADQPQNIALSKEMDRILKYQQEKEKYERELKMQRNLRVRREKKLNKLMDLEKNLIEAMKPFEEYIAKMEHQEEPTGLPAHTDEAVESMPPTRQQVRSLDKAGKNALKYFATKNTVNK